MQIRKIEIAGTEGRSVEISREAGSQTIKIQIIKKVTTRTGLRTKPEPAHGLDASVDSQILWTEAENIYYAVELEILRPRGHQPPGAGTHAGPADRQPPPPAEPDQVTETQTQTQTQGARP